MCQLCIGQYFLLIVNKYNKTYKTINTTLEKEKRKKTRHCDLWTYKKLGFAKKKTKVENYKH